METERLIIRPIKLDDKTEVFEYRSDTEANKYQGWIPQTVEDVETFIKKTSFRINEQGTWFQYVILRKDDQKIIGDIGIHFFDAQNKQVEIGCTLNGKFQHAGYAAEAMREVINYLFKVLEKHRIIASIDHDNVSSIRLVERLGFRKEAHFVRSLFVNGKWVDDVIYAVLNENWE
ncbi:MAG: GNAT family N-acetyltransferase [Bacteroidales bacterium]|nr:GNAT family N-acetyltransferase [Bacteroidales bacterium]